MCAINLNYAYDEPSFTKILCLAMKDRFILDTLSKSIELIGDDSKTMGFNTLKIF